jgi:hypothetical protein
VAGFRTANELPLAASTLCPSISIFTVFPRFFLELPETACPVLTRSGA